MKKKLEKLIEKFKKIESEIIEILNEKPAYFDENDESSLVKKSIKEYIKKINRAKKLFSEYEEIAKQIEDINNDEGDSAEFSKSVLSFRDTALIENLAEKNEENLVEEKVVKKKNKNNKKEKEDIKEL